VREARKAGKAAGKGGKNGAEKSADAAKPSDTPWEDKLCWTCNKKASDHPDGRFCRKDRAAVANEGGDDRKKEKSEEGSSDPKKKRKGKGKGKDKEQGLVVRETGAVREEVLFAVNSDAVVTEASLLSALADPDQFEDVCAQLSSRQTSLYELFEGAAKREKLPVSISHLPEDWIELSGDRPAGYCAQALLRFGGLEIVTMLDSGATCSVMPEEVALTIIANAESKGLDYESGAHPVRHIWKISEASSI
jgi:hypothetical protein